MAIGGLEMGISMWVINSAKMVTGTLKYSAKKTILNKNDME